MKTPELGDNELVQLNAIMEWALHRASAKTKEWLVPAGEKVAQELTRRGL